MNRLKALTILMMFVIPLAYASVVPRAQGITPLLEVRATNVFLTAGLENIIEIDLNNTGDFSVYQVEAILSMSTPVPGITVTQNEHTIINEIKGEELVKLYPKIYVDSGVTLGTYILNLQLSYRQIAATAPAKTVVVPIGIVVNRVYQAQVQLSILNGSLRAGTTNRVGIIVNNTGSSRVRGIDVALTSTTPLIMIPDGGRFSISGIDGKSSIDHELDLAVSKSASIGLYSLTAMVAYIGENGSTYSKTYTLSLSVDSVEVRQTEIVLRQSKTTPATINPGTSFSLDLELACLGAEAGNVKATVSFDAGSPLSATTPTTVALGNIEPRHSEFASFGVVVDGTTKSDSYPVRMTISYLDSFGLPKMAVEVVTIVVSGIYDFRLINVDEINAQRSSTADLIGDLLLIGTESVRFAQVEVVGDPSFVTTSTSSSYIGAIDPDSPIPLNIRVQISQNASLGVHSVGLNVTYYDNFNNVRGTVLEFPVTVVQATPTGQSQASFIDNLWIWLRRLFGLTP